MKTICKDNCQACNCYGPCACNCCCVSPDNVKAMQDWIADCFEDVDVDTLTPYQTMDAVERHYDGGFAQFIRDA